ncbi:MAG TPA: radical SAM protein [Deltaproteobacteria bacterium]|jgi:wyosine [tRNA(Phe)-imidazoG37] synthetase (radical SAM superfamily)|nr:MAG: molybdenum cofactor biosynthesis protein A [Deltaproteobacteria bacterium ADurb.Bin072]HNQ86382.1 radical SAM protein [Deltaproteobacteria bacterium]HRW80078.1 radical SAM protein [Desulfomonilia bacterium]HNS90774.1 radical SAM protein [Deltaproteobacteria bacterium]HOA44662.1 radical SAM protein [Deltaproteobacteria bacterium]
MERLEKKEHDFSAKLRQASVIGSLREYITWQRGLRTSSDAAPFPQHGPVSVNLDLTTACNFSCPHCVDSRLLNTGDYIDMDTIKKSLDTLQRNGLRSVILIGGGEPTIHKNFEDIVRFSKDRGLQVGIATNGSRLDKVSSVADVLMEGDWLRISLDAGRESTFFKAHRPRGRLSLESILEGARGIKQLNPTIQTGYSYVIVWGGIVVNGYELTPNIEEMEQAVRNAREYSFDYVSFKPCLLRLEASQKESLFDSPDPEREARIIEEIRNNLSAAEALASREVKILRSVNLEAMLDQKVHELKVQPDVCHSQFFRTVLAPGGIFHCPALRGVELARIGDFMGYKGKANLDFTQARLEHSIRSFNARLECSMVVCFYHHVNWWIENFIQSGSDVREIPTVRDNNFFL